MTKKVKKQTRRIRNRHGVRFHLIESGTFNFGTPADPYSWQLRGVGPVTITEPFFLAVTPITRAQWTSLMGTSPWLEDGLDDGSDDYPATNVSYLDAVAYCEKASRNGGLQYRIPTEAEWEYAARAGADTEYSFGDDSELLGEYAWYEDNSAGDLHPVGKKKCNTWGLYDTHGLVLEWTSDDWAYTRSIDQTVDPVVQNQDVRKTVKGGCYVSPSFQCAPYYRYGAHSEWRFGHVGFRPLLSAASVARVGARPTKAAVKART